jgi:hypothetical protein
MTGLKTVSTQPWKAKQVGGNYVIDDNTAGGGAIDVDRIKAIISKIGSKANSFVPVQGKSNHGHGTDSGSRKTGFVAPEIEGHYSGYASRLDNLSNMNQGERAVFEAEADLAMALMNRGDK